MVGTEYVLWVVLLLVALLAGAVLYLLISSRNFQRIDYSHLIGQDERQRRLEARINQLEQMLGDLANYDERRRNELEHFVKAARGELADVVRRARTEIVDGVLNEPHRIDSLLLQESGVELPDVYPTRSEQHPVRTVDTSRNMVNFLKGPRQRRIAEQLELGYTSQEVSRMLGVSRHEVELVGSIIFRNKSA